MIMEGHANEEALKLNLKLDEKLWNQKKNASVIHLANDCVLLGMLLRIETIAVLMFRFFYEMMLQ